MTARMIDLYSFTTPNGFKASIALEELGLPYRVHTIDIGKGEQHTPEFLAINPNGKIPAIVDTEGPGGTPFTVFESGAILLYLAEKTGKLIPADPRGRSEVIQWLMFQMGGVGPMFGQYGHFVTYAKEKIPYAIERYSNEVDRLVQVLDGQLAKHPFVAGDAYSIADVALFPWIHLTADRAPKILHTAPHVKKWVETVLARPAVQKGLNVPAVQKE